MFLCLDKVQFQFIYFPEEIYIYIQKYIKYITKMLVKVH